MLESKMVGPTAGAQRLVWSRTLRKKTVETKKRVLVVENESFYVNAKESLEVFKYKIRSRLGIPEFVFIFLLVDDHVLTESRLRRIPNNTSIRMIQFRGRRVNFCDLFQTKSGMKRLTIKTLGDSFMVSAYTYDLTKYDTVLGLKLMITTDYKRLLLLKAPNSLTNSVRVVQLEDNLFLWQLPINANLYLRQVEKQRKSVLFHDDHVQKRLLEDDSSCTCNPANNFPQLPSSVLPVLMNASTLEDAYPSSSHEDNNNQFSTCASTRSAHLAVPSLSCTGVNDDAPPPPHPKKLEVQRRRASL